MKRTAIIARPAFGMLFVIARELKLRGRTLGVIDIDKDGSATASRNWVWLPHSRYVQS